MILKDIVMEDFVNYRKPSMFLVFPKCDFKCCKEAGNEICQNMSIVSQPDIEVSVEAIVDRFMKNPISKAIVCGGLEPFFDDSFNDLLDLVHELRWTRGDFSDIVIYTGYYPNEIADKLECLKKYENIIVKFGRFVPNKEEHFDKVLGVNLASDNQWAEVIS